MKSKIADTNLVETNGYSGDKNSPFSSKSWWAVNIAYFLAAIAALYVTPVTASSCKRIQKLLIQKWNPKIADTNLVEANGYSGDENSPFNSKSWWAVNIAYFLAVIAALYVTPVTASSCKRIQKLLIQKRKSKIADLNLGKANGNSSVENSLFNIKS